MKKILLMFLMAVTFGFAGFNVTDAKAESEKIGMYITPKFMFDAVTGDYMKRTNGSSSGVKRMSDTFGGALAVGYNFYDNFAIPVRVEVEYGIRADTHFDYRSKDIVARTPQSLMTNAYLDFVNSTDFTPYVGGGIGVGFIGYNTNFAWNVGGGVMYTLTDNWKLDLGYRYLDLGEFEYKHVKANFNAHEVMLGAQFSF